MISLDLPPAGGKLCEAFWIVSSKPPAKPEVLIHMYRTTMHTMDTAITMMVAGAQ